MATRQCIFCNIAQEKSPETEILYKDEEVVVFRDHRPASTYHYLVIPKQHIKNAKQLTHEHVPLVDALVRAGQQVLQEQGGDPGDVRMGFHYPPVVLVNHLHLHVISPASQLSFMGRLLFRDNSYWFASAEWVQDHLRKLADELQGCDVQAGRHLEVE